MPAFIDLIKNPEATALGVVFKLQPVAGQGAKIHPTKYAADTKPKFAYNLEKRVVPQPDGQLKHSETAILNSEQSVANHLELALLHGKEEGFIKLPLISIEFPKDLCQGKVNTLTAPHRLADALFRESLLGDKPFNQTPYADEWGKATNQDVSILFRLCPTALIFGMWGSPRGPGKPGCKLERCITSEVVAYDVVTGQRAMSKTCPVGIIKANGLKLNVDEKGNLKQVTAKAKDPSELGLGPAINGLEIGGITCAYAQETTTISLPALRKYNVMIDGKLNKEASELVRAALLSLTMAAWYLRLQTGYNLRSGCHLHLEEKPDWKTISIYGERESFQTTLDDCLEQYNSYLAQLDKLGLRYEKDMVLKPSPILINMIKNSLENAGKQDDQN